MTFIVADNQTGEIAIDTPGRHTVVIADVSASLMITVAHRRAHVKILGRYALRGDQARTLTLTTHHTVPGATSHTEIRSVLSGRGRLHVKTLIRIDMACGGTTATLAHHTLLTSGTPYVQTVPVLEIIPADVTCTHAATVTRPDDEQVATLMRRGLSRARAVHLLADGFLAELDARIARTR